MSDATGQPLAAQLVGVSHRYRNILALDDVDLEVPRGRTVGVIGPDGVGKSTLLALLAGVRRLQRGAVTVLGGDMSRARERRRVCPRIAYMPQGLGKNLYPSLSVFENVDFFGRLFGQPRAERHARIAELLESTDLAPFRQRPAGKLSGGMKQKLGLCCALIHDPELLILDEPTTGVDPLSRREFWRLIDRIRERGDHVSVLVATAYMDEAEQFDHLVAMDQGRVLARGSPAQLLASTGSAGLEAAFIALLPEHKRGDRQPLSAPPRVASPESAPAIVARGLSKRFADFTAVDQVDFAIERGEIFGFLGSNGCGKTTTMKILTGLLPASEGQALLFGEPVDADDIDRRRRIGFMSQAFSLYSELTVNQNLVLHARLFHFPKEQIASRCHELIERFELAGHADQPAAELPLGIRQRLSLAVALIHRPEILILDEPTSGVDPISRDRFWALLLDIARGQGVTIFISTHFMNEAERCDRISLMHAGRVLASDTPAALIRSQGVATLEQAFIAYLEQASDAARSTQVSGAASAPEKMSCSTDQSSPVGQAQSSRLRPSRLRPSRLRPSLLRLSGYAHRESLELLRDPVRLAFASVGSVLLMLVLGYGINLDVEDIAFAVLDRDRTPQSRAYIDNIAGSRYFLEQPPVATTADLERRMRDGKLSLAIEIAPGFGRDLKRGHAPQLFAWIDGAMPSRAETVSGYLHGLHANYLDRLATLSPNPTEGPAAANLVVRYRYNQDFKSLYAIVPANIPLLLALIPAILMALAVVREKDLGSIINFYATPVSKLEFLVGKQLPYIAVSMVNFFALMLIAVWFFQVPLKGSLWALSLGALLYVTAMTSWGLLISTFTRSQTAAIFGTAIATMMPATQFSGLIDPVSSMEGVAALIGTLFPTTYFMIISRGAFTKALDLADLYPYHLALAGFIPVLTLLCVLLLKKQER